MNEKENALPAVASMVGGAVICLQGVIMLIVPWSSDSISDMALFYGLFVMVLGVTSFILGISIWSSKKAVNSLVILLLAILAMLFAGGGFLIGSVLASVGGILSLLS